MISIKEDIITKIQKADDAQLLAEIHRILDANDYIFTAEDVSSLRKADEEIDNGNYKTQQQVKSNIQQWINNLK